MLIGIVILNYKTYKDTEKLVLEILEQKSPYNIYIQIIDNFSPNNSYVYLKDRFSNLMNVNVYSSSENGGFAKGNNIGLRLLEHLRPDYVLILNNDVHFELSVLEKCVLAYKELPSPGMISPVQFTPDGKCAEFPELRCNSFFEDLCCTSLILNKLFHPMSIHQYYSNTKWENVQEVDTIPGCFIFINFNIFKSVGYFDESTFLFCEERFLYKKLDLIGLKNYILLDCSYIHEHSTTINSEVSRINQLKLLNEGYISFTKKYRRFPRLKVLLLKLAFLIRKIEVQLYKIRLK